MVGNPNCGKSVIFNALTHSHQHVGNWPGVTVDIAQGVARSGDIEVDLVDLPGTYSLSPGPPDETVARQFILEGNADAIINVVDATNLERHLYLTLQLLELGVPTVVALNMMDEARRMGLDIDVQALSQELRVPVVPTVATTGEGLKRVLKQAVELAAAGEAAGNEAGEAVSRAGESDGSAPGRPGTLQVEATVSEENAVRRYERAAAIVAATVHVDEESAGAKSLTQRIDAIVLHRWLAFPVFAAVMAAMFGFTFTLGGPLSDMAAELMGRVGGALARGLEMVGAPELLTSFVVDGIAGGVGAVLEFAPPVFALFLAISLLEDSGYMARAATISDRFMAMLGLSGRACIPMILGFGCNVTGILATRALDNRRERLVSILINPLVSCAARLPVYVLFATALFPRYRALVVFSVYALGVALAAGMAKLLSMWLLRQESRAGEATAPSAFLMELPPYRMPSASTVLRATWIRCYDFLTRAGTIIVMGVAIMWVLTNVPPGSDGGEGSLMGFIGGLIAPLFRPAGFGTWQAASALITGFFAKEMIAGSLGVLYGSGETGVSAALAAAFTPAAAYAFIVMSMAYVPCVATVAAIRRETGSTGWTVFAVVYQLVLAWMLAVVAYQTLSLIWG